MNRAVYLGDGAYARFESGMIWVYTDRVALDTTIVDGMIRHEVALDRSAMGILEAFFDEHKKEM